MKNINIALFECDPFNGNKGVAALAYSAIAMLDEIFSNKGIEYTIYVVTWASAEYKNVIDLNGKRITFYCINPIDWSTNKKRLQLFLFSFLPHKKYRYWKYLKFDYAFNAGSGDSFADIYGKTRFLRVNTHIKICSKFGIPQVLLPQTIGPFNDMQIREMAIDSMNTCKYLFARDEQSYNYITKELSVPSNKCKELIDMAFFLPYSRISIPDDKINVGLNVSGLLWKGGYTKDNQFNLTVDYQKLIRSIIEYFLKKENVTLYLVAHALNRKAGTENDYAVNKTLIEEYHNEHLRLAPYFDTPIEAKNFISALDFFTGARMHSTIAAFSSGVPVVPMSYSRKFEGLFENTLGFPHIVHMNSCSQEFALGCIKEAFDNRESLKNCIRNINETIVEKRKKLLLNSMSDFFGIQ